MGIELDLLLNYPLHFLQSKLNAENADLDETVCQVRYTFILKFLIIKKRYTNNLLTLILKKNVIFFKALLILFRLSCWYHPPDLVMLQIILFLLLFLRVRVLNHLNNSHFLVTKNHTFPGMRFIILIFSTKAS